MRFTFAALAGSALLLAGSVYAQKIPDNAPAGSTVQCKDGSFESPQSKSGACSGHKGIKTWYGKTADKPASDATEKQGARRDRSGDKDPSASKPAVQTQSAEVRNTEVAPSTGTATKAPANQDSSKMAGATGGGAGKVWVNEDSKVYHCMGDRYYGKTKKGEYMSESEATAKGARPANKKACTAS